MRRRRRHQRKSPSVELNLAAMLDMAFQLLAFFILTFRPAPIEGHLQLHMPPPVALTNVRSEEQSKEGNGYDPSDWKTLDLFITATDDGEASAVAIGFENQSLIQGRLSPENLRQLSRQLKSIFDADQVVFDRVQLAVDGRLHYDELMKVVDVCTQQVLPNGQMLNRISFIDLSHSPETQASR